ncbi:DUF3983 domain-containing protein [Bacillus sp. SN10]|nr:DUF3983 domain-containing protein [Bacillus sp. SN10]PKJ52590.1 DUF3983 domain-containing protein [Bacillus sp. SN10]
MIDMNKKRMKKAIARRKKEIDKSRVNYAWRNIFVKSGFLE